MRIRLVIERDPEKVRERQYRKIVRTRDELDDARAERDRIELFTGPPHYGPPSRLRQANVRVTFLEEKLAELDPREREE